MSQGKGSSRRPSDIPKAVRDENWERTFGDGRDKMRQPPAEAKAVVDSAPPYILPCTQDPQ